MHPTHALIPSRPLIAAALLASLALPAGAST